MFIGIYTNQFKLIIEFTGVIVKNKNDYVLGIPTGDFIGNTIEVLIFLGLLIIFLKKRKYYLERYEVNWLMPVSK